MTTGTQITPLQQLSQGMQKMEGNFRSALPKGMSVERFIKTATNAIAMHPEKDKLLSADRQSLYMACQKAASDGLEVDGRESTLVVFSGKVQYMPMTQGLVKLARNSGEIAAISSEVVYENDEFEFYEDFDGSKFKHQINWRVDRGQPLLVWAKVKLTNGETIIRALTKSRVLKIASKSKNTYQYDPLKGDHFEEWWRKTAIKNVLKYAPRSTYLEQALESDDKAEAGEFLDIAPESPAPAKAERKTKVSEAVKEQAAPQEEAIPQPAHDAETGEVFEADYEEEIPV
jgi:recombination protein RecT